jgi:hypothetical protein
METTKVVLDVGSCPFATGSPTSTGEGTYLEEIAASKKGCTLMKQEKQLSSQEILPIIEEAELEKVTGGGPGSPLLGGKNVSHLSDMAHPKSTDEGVYFPPDLYQIRLQTQRSCFLMLSQVQTLALLMIKSSRQRRLQTMRHLMA